MEIFEVLLTFLLLKNVLSENTWERANNELIGVHQNVQKTSIVGYNKLKMTKHDIEEEKKRIQHECQCSVENLASIGAFILTYDNPCHTSISSLSIDDSKEIGIEDQILTTFNEEIPTDPQFNRQWALHDLPNNADINAAEGWKEYMSDSKGGDPDGPSVVVAVIDSGVDYNHPDLKDIMWINSEEIPDNGQDDDNNGIVDDVYGADFNSPVNGDPIDRSSHGTHCAGIIAAKENNGKGIAGVASFTQGKVKIMAVKGCSGHFCPLSNMFKSLNYAINKGATISSNSWGGGILHEQLWKMILQNIPDHLFIASAGNSNKLIDNNYRPWTCGVQEPNLLCVASSTKQDTISKTSERGSNYGKDYVHVFAPGSDIYSTIPNNHYASYSGTSMACPHVSGLAALIKTMRPYMTAREIRKIIEANVQKKATYENIVSSGGIIDLGKTLKGLQTVYFIAGGSSKATDGTERDIEFYHPNVKNLNCAITPPSLRNMWRIHTNFYHNNTIHLCGGVWTESTCVSYNSEMKDWKTHTLSPSRYAGHSSVVLKNTLFVIGGYESRDQLSPLGTMSTPLPLTNKPVFNSVPNLPYKGMHQCATKLDEDTLVISGGKEGASGSSVSSIVIKYDTMTSTATQLPSLKEERAQHECVMMEMDKKKWLIVSGGYANGREMKSTEMLEMGGSSWVSLGDLNVARSGHAMIVTPRGIMVIGGWLSGAVDEGAGNLKSVELLDWTTKKWTLVEPSLNRARRLFGEALEIPATMFDCPVTADVCKHTDKFTNCPIWKTPYCTNGWAQWMAKYCAKTCKC